VLLPILPSIALVVRLAGYGRSWLPSPIILALLVGLAHFLAAASLPRLLGFVQRFHADRSFGGHMGHDYEIYAVPKSPEGAQ
jgi:hypothetical protein